ncbi:LPS-assembly protein LptD [Paraburkholderia megapolitana]|uniref:LPS-assembly protein LptD n=1 Tax=Paraburkholderia megapolitana TaxID=420953 RepID=UPI0038B8C391
MTLRSTLRGFRLKPLISLVLLTAGWVPPAVYAQLTGTAAAPESLGGQWDLRLTPQLAEHSLPTNQKAATLTLGNSETATTDTDLALKGNAELRRYTSAVKGDYVHYAFDTDIADAYGAVQIVNDGNVFTGPEAHLRVDANEGYMPVPKYRFSLTGGWGSAQRIDLIDNERSVIHDGTYTTCPCDGQPAWYVKASQFNIDQGADDGIAHDGVLFFQGVPIFASPWLSFPLSNDRQSGLLPPTFSIGSTNGIDIALPYYFNIAPNYDLTLTPRYMSKRGEMLSADYRYLTAKSSGTMDVAYLPDDAITKTNRYSIAVVQNWTIAPGLAGYVNYNRVSDASVTTDLASGTAFPTSSTTLYQQEAGLTYNNGPWSVLAREQRWQTFSTDTTYNREPQVDVRYSQYNVDGFDFGTQADATRFTLPGTGVTEGNRFTFTPYISYPIVRPGWFFTPQLKWHFVDYDLSSIGSDAPAGQPKTFSFNVPTLSLDSGMTFERSVRLFGHAFIQTLEPRLYYVYTPYRNQQFAPLFDTAEADFGLSEIFTDNTFVGGDRVADASRITAAVTSRLIDPSSGDEKARFTVAQLYDFRAPQVTLVDGEPISDMSRTGIIVGASYKIGPGFSAEQAVQYNEIEHYLSRATVGFGWAPATREVLNFAYHYTREDETLDYEPVNQFIVSEQWPLARQLSSVARINYDMVTHRLIAGLLGLQYDADCWAVSIAFEKYTNASSTTEPSTGTRVLMQLQLKGFSKIDNGLLDQFRANVPGYTPLPASDAPTSRFSDYP